MVYIKFRILGLCLNKIIIYKFFVIVYFANDKILYYYSLMGASNISYKHIQGENQEVIHQGLTNPLNISNTKFKVFVLDFTLGFCLLNFI